MRRSNTPLAVVLLLGGCAAVPDSPPTPQDAARAAFEAAQDTFEGGNYLEAVREFQQVRTRHPYSTWATLAELRLADCQFELGKYLESVEAYRSFIRFHPHHERVVYAQFRIGESYVQEMPEDWFFMPPAYEKDQASTREAVRALGEFLASRGDSEYGDRARDLLRRCRRRLADHEMYVARFYLEQEEPRAAASRLERLTDSFPDVGLTEEALFLLGRVYLTLEDPAKAAAALRRLVTDYPEHAHVPAARQLLDGLPEAPPPEPVPPTQSES